MSKPLTPEAVEAMRERERLVVTQMIGVYCRGNHGTPAVGSARSAPR